MRIDLQEFNESSAGGKFGIVVGSSGMMKIGRTTTRMIIDRSLEGIDKDGNQFAAYSTHPFKMPAGAITKRARKALAKDGTIRYFKRDRKLWVVVMGGYAQLKKAIYKQAEGYTGKPNLWQTGAMMRALRPIESENNSVTIGFTRSEEAQKAYWNMLKGREFLGLTAEETRSPEFVSAVLQGVVWK